MVQLRALDLLPGPVHAYAAAVELELSPPTQTHSHRHAHAPLPPPGVRPSRPPPLARLLACLPWGARCL